MDGDPAYEARVAAWVASHQKRPRKRHSKSENIDAFELAQEGAAAAAAAPLSRCWAYRGSLKRYMEYKDPPVLDWALYFDGAVDRFDDLTTLPSYKTHFYYVDLEKDLLDIFVQFKRVVSVDNLMEMYQDIDWEPSRTAVLEHSPKKPKASRVPLSVGKKYMIL